MASKRRRYQRPLGKRCYRKLFVLATEGSKTEPQYFAMLNSQNSVIHIKCLKSKHRSSPPAVLKKLKDHLKKEGLRKSDEAWIVCDKDEWTDDQLLQLYKWSFDADNYGLAVSNPKFEYWLLLHFEDGNDVTSPNECTRRLKRYLPDYDKGIDVRMISNEMIVKAVERAKRIDSAPFSNWPHTTGTTVYRLVENILNA